MPLDFSYEKKLIKRGYKIIAGVDEVGRGPLAGPVTAVAVTGSGNPKFEIRNSKLLFSGLKDSKQLSPKKREEFYNFFTKELGINWAVASVTPKIIDRINIHQANKLAMKRAVLRLSRKMSGRTDSTISPQADIVLIDGNISIDLPIKQVSIIKGDEQIALIAIASIIAKVTRDRAMLRYHKKFPEYRFDLHKGYGTKLHFAMLRKHGASPIHRRSFNPLRGTRSPF